VLLRRDAKEEIERETNLRLLMRLSLVSEYVLRGIMKYRTAEKKFLSIFCSVLVLSVLLAFCGHDRGLAVDSIATIKIGGTAGDGRHEGSRQAFQKNIPAGYHFYPKLVPGRITAVTAGAIDIGLTGRS